jgi:hypothetical protein
MSDSNSDSSNKTSTTTTNNTTYADKRNVASDGGVSVSGDGNTVMNSYQTTDLGAVQAGVTLAGNVATKALDLSTVGLAGVLDALKATAASNKDVFDQTIKLVGDNTKDAKEAFAKATEEVNGNRVLVGMGVIAIGFALAKGAYK